MAQALKNTGLKLSWCTESYFVNTRHKLSKRYDLRPCCAMFRSKSCFSDMDACIVHVAVVDLRRLWLLANHRGQHRPVCALRRSFLLFVGSMCHHAADVSVNFMFGTTIFNQHQLWSSSGAMRVCSDNSCKEDASFRARFFLLLAWLTRIMFAYCSLALGLFFLCVVDRHSFFVFIVVVHAVDCRHA